MAFIDAELSDVADNFRKAASQLERLIVDDPHVVGSTLSRIDMDHILKLVGEHLDIKRALHESATKP